MPLIRPVCNLSDELVLATLLDDESELVQKVLQGDARWIRKREERQSDDFRSWQILRRQQRNAMSPPEAGKWLEHSSSLDAASSVLFI